MSKQSDYTLTELLVAIAAVGMAGLFVTVIYVAAHFIGKFW